MYWQSSVQRMIVASALMLAGFFSYGAKADTMDIGDTPVFLKIEFDLQRAHLDQFMQIMQTLDVGMQSEEGFLEAQVYVNNSDDCKITLIEKWETQQLHEVHYRRIVDNGSWAEILNMLKHEPAMSYHHKVRQKAE
ncbi:putative quinol monooxygenase [Kordiimonas gwangyangensis]|uniref:putative quinol monooxygenase n=1 Tax=Kordiimonas gwangyangensis TaxID=288022 RepID=UPI00046ED466|nr:antibiotic biosynthesis monooxygenase [Kordiimonas gwangyangensis]